MKKKNITLLFRYFEKEHIGKDVFMVPYYLGQQNEANVAIVYPVTSTNSDLPKSIRGVKLIPLRFNRRMITSSLGIELAFFWYLVKNARKINVLVLFHYTWQTVVMISLYKWINPKGFGYVKADIDAKSITSSLRNSRGVKTIVSEKLYRNFTRKVDCFSCETTLAYAKIIEASSCIWNLNSKLLLLPNGFDEELFMSLNIKECSFEEKDDLIITVGRLGTKPKNTQMFLKALENIDLQHWKVCLIGPIEEEFKAIIQDFYKRCPKKKDTVIFTGAIYDKKELWEYYNKAKVFVLTSRWEGYPIVFPEAKRFKNYIITTPIAAANDIIEHGKYGKLVSQNAYLELSETLSDIINCNIDVNVYEDYNIKLLSWEYLVKKIRVW